MNTVFKLLVGILLLLSFLDKLEAQEDCEHLAKVFLAILEQQQYERYDSLVISEDALIKLMYLEDCHETRVSLAAVKDSLYLALTGSSSAFQLMLEDAGVDHEPLELISCQIMNSEVLEIEALAGDRLLALELPAVYLDRYYIFGGIHYYWKEKLFEGGKKEKEILHGTNNSSELAGRKGMALNAVKGCFEEKRFDEYGDFHDMNFMFRDDLVLDEHEFYIIGMSSDLKAARRTIYLRVHLDSGTCRLDKP